MKEVNKTYSISQVAQIVGLSIHVLRAWEKRYGVIAPQRNGMHRGYTHQDVEKLLSLKKMVESGIPIGKAVTYSPDEVDSILNLREEEFDIIHQKLIEHLKHYQWTEFQALFPSLLEKIKQDDFVSKICFPLIAQIGLQVESGKLGIEHEHFASESIRDFVSRLPIPKSPTNKMLITFSGLEGDHHDLGLFLASRLALWRGHPIIYLGPHLPTKEMAKILKEFNPTAALISASTIRENIKELPLFLEQMEKLTAKHCPATQILIAGTFLQKYEGKINLISHIQHWIDYLDRLSAKEPDHGT